MSRFPMLSRPSYKVIYGLAVSFTVLAVLLISSSVSQQRNALPNDFEIHLDAPEAVIPCTCSHLWNRVADKPEMQISVVTSTAVRGPLTYKYSINGGKILGDGPMAIWDFKEVAPGEYELDVVVSDDLSGLSKRITRNIRLIESPVCDCPYTCPSFQIRSDKKTVRPGDKITFHLSMLGGETAENPVRYNWKVTDGVLNSGQGTIEVSIITDRHPKNPEVGIAVTVNGLRPDYNCPDLATDSVDFGPQSIVNELNSGPLALVLDEQLLTVSCPAGQKGCNNLSSPDMIIDGLFETMKPRPDSDYRYKVSAGKIIGTGNRFRWDLSNIAPGSYTIEASEWRKGKLYGEKKTQTVNIVSAICICDPSCPVISINVSEREFEPGETVDVSASITGGSQDKPALFNWTTSEGEIISGQMTQLIRIKLPSTRMTKKPVITLTLGGIDPRFACPNTAQQEINLMSVP